MPTTDISYAVAPTTVVTVDKEKFEEMVLWRLRTWDSIAAEVSKLYPVEGVNIELFQKAKSAASRYRKGDRTRENFLVMGRGWADWYLTCKEKEGKVVYLRGQENVA
jgi:hypothetical protein